MIKLLSTLPLASADLLQNEGRLEGWFRRFLQFENFSLFFPPQVSSMSSWLLTEEKKLFIPLAWHGNILAVALFGGISVRETKRILPWCDRLGSACLEALALTMRIRLDPDNGLATEEAFFAHFANQTALHRVNSGEGSPSLYLSSMHKLCLGMVVLSFFDLPRITREFDHDFLENLFLQAARAVATNLPENAVAARLGRYEGRCEIGILFSAFGRKAGNELSRSLLARIDQLGCKDSASGKTVCLRMHAGHALYPQDMQGNEFVLPALEQAVRLRNRARHAAWCAWLANGTSRKERVLAFADILRSGGTVLENLGGGRVRISLGSAANAREGMRFALYGRKSGAEPVNKGQLLVLQTHPRFSIAEVLYLSQPGLEPEEGDTLELIPLSRDNVTIADSPEPPAEQTLVDFKSHGDFLKALPKTIARCSRFALAIARIDQLAGKPSGFYGKLEQRAHQLEATLSLPSLAGLYGSNGIVFLYTGTDTPDSLKFANILASLAGECECGFACGIFNYPFLEFAKSESEECALKALEYAQLLPAPHIGVLDSVALNISADKLFSLGDTLGAIREYKNAVLADPGNALALNSLGVCLCAIGKSAAGRKYFADALAVAATPEVTAKIYYNLGAIAQKEGDIDQAIAAYRRCARNDRSHVFAFLRLGQIFQTQGKRTQARRYYKHAISSAAASPELLNLAERHLARLEAGTSHMTATGLLHDTLARNPDDPSSLAMLARIYLEEGDDPDTAASLGRQSVRLGGGVDALLVLEKALLRLGRSDEAEVIRKRILQARRSPT